MPLVRDENGASTLLPASQSAMDGQPLDIQFEAVQTAALESADAPDPNLDFDPDI